MGRDARGPGANWYGPFLEKCLEGCTDNDISVGYLKGYVDPTRTTNAWSDHMEPSPGLSHYPQPSIPTTSVPSIETAF